MLDRKLLLNVAQEASITKTANHELVMNLVNASGADFSFRLVPSRVNGYALVAVDGSQIYPDRHRIGGEVGLVNTGGVRFLYGAQQAVAAKSSVEFLSDIELVKGTVDELVTPEEVDRVREERELQWALKWSEPFSGESLVLFDGVLTLGHAMGKKSGAELLGALVSTFESFYERRQLVAAYMSMPRTRDLTKMLQARVCKAGCKGDCGLPACAQLKELYDRDLMQKILPMPADGQYAMSELLPTTMSQVPEHLRPWFYYLRTETEVARVELPAWIAGDQALVGRLARMVADQVRKGRGYPIALSEAHEHAVIKAADREFFYELIGARGLSTKLERKQGSSV